MTGRGVLNVVRWAQAETDQKPQTDTDVAVAGELQAEEDGAAVAMTERIHLK